MPGWYYPWLYREAQAATSAQTQEALELRRRPTESARVTGLQPNRVGVFVPGAGARAFHFEQVCYRRTDRG